VGLRWTRRSEFGGMPITLTTGADYDRASEDRKGYLNESGTRTLLKRNEDNTVDSWGAYLQGELALTDRLSASAGLRYTIVSFDSEDNFICTIGDALCPGGGVTTPVAGRTTNPNDSGSVGHEGWTPVGGLLYKLTPTLNLYANAGQSLETPTFIELAYQSDPAATGPNLGLRPAESNHYEVGAKAYLGANTRLDVALFQIDTQDEIVVESNSGGRQSYQNAGDTRRTGIEVGLTSDLGRGFGAYVAATYLDAVFKDSFETCPSPAPPGPPCATRVTVNAGNTIPGVPPYTVFGELSYRYAPMGFTAGVEVRVQGKVYVNDTNSESADEFSVVNLRAGFEQRVGRWRLNESVRVDNVFDTQYVGGVIVNDSGGRYYAPAPASSLLVGVTAAYSF
jgi:iron complex outermembrane receptor protein